MGCLRADGRERQLLAGDVRETALAGTYAALVTPRTIGNPEGYGEGVGVFDLRTGAPVTDRGGEQAVCLYPSNPPCESSMDQLVLGSDAVSAVHATVRDNGCITCTVEQILATDRTGVNKTLDSVTEPDGSPPALTNLTLTGDTLTWQHNGTPRSAQLQP